MTDLHLSGATPRDLPTLSALLATAFEDDPTMHRLLPGAHDRRARLTGMLSAELGALLAGGGVVDLARSTPAGPLLGVAAWAPPETERSRRTRLRSSAREAAVAVRIARLVRPRDLLASRRAFAAFERLRPSTPHWYLADIAVAPDAAGRGVGGALLRRGTARADADGVPAYLEATSTRSRRLYARHGFVDGVAMDWDPTGAPFTMLRPVPTTDH